MRPGLAPRMLGWFVVSLAAFACAWGCDSAEEAGCDRRESLCCNAPEVECGCRVADPYPRCLITRGCARSSECPSGTQCVSLASGTLCDEGVACCREGPGGRCELPAEPSLAPRALISGFGVSKLDLVSDFGSQGATITWVPPGDASVVVCAVFGCQPEVESVGQGQLTITNFDPCVLAVKSSRPEIRSFDLSDTRFQYPSDKADDACDIASVSATRHVTSLTAGCWAYGREGVIAASELQPLQPKQVNSRWLVSDTCQGNDRKSCFIESSSAWGTCESGVCRRRCQDPSDCSRGTASEGDDPAEQLCCLLDADDRVGVCVDPDGGYKGDTELCK